MLARSAAQVSGEVRGQDEPGHDDLRRAQRRGPAAGPGGGSARPARQYRRPAVGAGRGGPFRAQLRHGDLARTAGRHRREARRRPGGRCGRLAGRLGAGVPARLPGGRPPAGDRAVRAAARGTVVPGPARRRHRRPDGAIGPAARSAAALSRRRCAARRPAGRPRPTPDAGTDPAGPAAHAGGPAAASDRTGRAGQPGRRAAGGGGAGGPVGAGAALATGRQRARSWPGFRRPGPGGVEGRALPRRGRRDVLRGGTRHRAAAEHAGHRACPDRRTACSGGPARRA